MNNKSFKNIIYDCIYNILMRENKEYATLPEIYNEVASFLEVENNNILKSKIRGRLQENSKDCTSFCGDDLFHTEKIRSGKWTIKHYKKLYIRYINNKYLITNDEWNSVECVDCINEFYELEKNQDNVFKGKLTYEYGKRKAKIIINELEIIRGLLDRISINKKNEGYGSAFEVFAISTYYNIEYEECINKYIINGDYDGKIDAIYFNNDEIFIYQIKLNEINSDDFNIMKINYEQCIKGKIPNYGKDLYHYIIKHKDSLKNKKIHFCSISNNLNYDTNIKPSYIFNKYFENKLLPIDKNNIELNIIKPSIKIDNIYQYNVSKDNNNNFCFYIEADNLIKYLIEALGVNPNSYNNVTIDISKYFNDNVRGILNTNKNMIKTIDTEPENFIKYNNGISITGQVIDTGIGILIKNPVINNGQQTITTLIRYNKNLDKIILPVKITNETDFNIKSKISRYSNEQYKVKSIDMLSLNAYIRLIQKEIYNKGKYFLEIYSSGKKSYHSTITNLYNKEEIISLLDFIKLYFSIINKKDLGNWKNNPNSQIEKINIDTRFDLDLSIKVCKAISDYEKHIKNIDNKKDKDNLKSADLAFKYLLCNENLNEFEAHQVINLVNEEYFYKNSLEKSKLIDIYKSSNVIVKIEEQLKKFRKNKDNSKLCI